MRSGGAAADLEQRRRAIQLLNNGFFTIELGMEPGGGPATASARFALEMMEDVFGELRPEGP